MGNEIVGLLFNRIDVTCPLPCDLINGLILRTPTELELSEFRKALTKHPTSPYDMTWIFECDPKWNDDRTVMKFEERDPRKPKQYVASIAIDKYDAYNDAFRALEKATSVSAIPLRIHHQLRPSWGLVVTNIPRIEMLSEFMNKGDLDQIDETYIADLANINSKLAALGQSGAEILASLELLWQLSDPIRHEQLYALGLFAVIESLVTHDPDTRQSSIKKQLIAKVLLLEKRLPRPLPYALLEQRDHETAWHLLYDYRSCIAHGKTVDFKEKFKKLKSPNSVRRFLDTSVRSILRYSLDEPQLVLDLKNC